MDIVDLQEYNILSNEEKKKTFVKNSFYKTNEFKDKYKQAFFLILAEEYKEFYKNNRILPIPEEILKRNREYLANSDEFLNWFEDNYEKTNNKKDIIKLKIVYEKFKNSEYFHNLNKSEKRDNNYKNFASRPKNIFNLSLKCQ